MVPANKGYSIRIADLKGQQQQERLDAIEASIDKVT